jgi:cytoskeleton protein RodZ
MTTQDSKQVDELSEDMIVVGPGQMLSEARIKLSLSVEDVADKLKFKKSLVQNIEQDIFDQKLPATFNRGYLRSYAKLVNVDTNDVLSAYDMLGVAEVQRSEMQSFSNLTEKQAEHSRLMWFSYLIVAILFGLMVLWWLQEPTQLVDENLLKQAQITNTQGADTDENTTSELSVLENELASDKPDESITPLLPNTKSTEQALVESETIVPKVEKIADAEEVTLENTLSVNQEPIAELSTAVFTFSGDCWVNIYDATGERIAWGVKKSGYVMTVSGKAPLKITLGKPELASIVFNGQSIDMSPFNVGNIAKFTLPLNL